jgi:hypothetical protein
MLKNFNHVGAVIQTGLIQGIDSAAGVEGLYTDQEFWTRQGTNGAAVLNVFAELRTVLTDIYPVLVTPEISQAGENLIVNPDGSVTVKS